MYLFSFKKPSKHTLSRQSKALCLLSLFLVFAFSGRGQTPTDSARNVADVVGEWLSAEYGLQPSTNNRLVIFKNGQEKFDDLFKAIKQPGTAYTWNILTSATIPSQPCSSTSWPKRQLREWK